MHRSLCRILVLLALLATACSSSDDGAEDGSQDPTEVGTPTGGYEAEIVRTTDGVPHISGSTVDDVTFGQGYASAQDRSCDLIDQIVMIRGERARFLGAGDGEGDEHLRSDLAWKTIGIFDRATKDFTEASPEAQNLMTAYAAGWNAHLAEVGGDGINGWCAGEEWVRPVEPDEVYAYARSITLQASSGAVRNFLVGAEPPTVDGSTVPDEDEGAVPAFDLDLEVASNGWAIGADRSTNGSGLLVANPHFPWEGALRFWEVHLTVPGAFDAYGSQLSGLPGLAVGFTDTFAWTHTVSKGNRFTGYQVELVEGSPTTYRYGDEEREMETDEISIEVLGDDGELTTETRTIYSTHYGPVLNIDLLPWDESQAITYRDANIDNDDFVEQYRAMVTAADLDEFIEIHETVTGVPLFNTVAVSNDGRAWYADTSATPNLSDAAITGWLDDLDNNPVVSVAFDQGFVLLDGSDPENEWVEVDGARDPGLVPYSAMPVTERSDVVFNANDSFWVSHPSEFLAGDFSPLHGMQDIEQIPRTRQNAFLLGDTSADGPAGDDGTFDVTELRDLVLDNEGATPRLLREDLVERCRATTSVVVPADPESDLLPASEGPVDLTEACDVLAAWDGRFELDSVGPHIWKEWIGGIDGDTAFATPFDPADPVGTPAGLAAGPTDGADPALVQLGRAVLVLDAAGFPLDQPWGEIQFSDRNGERIPIHGGDDRDGTTNIVRSSGSDTLEPLPELADRVSPDSQLRADGHPVSGGSSFIMTVGFSPDGTPEAYSLLNYSNTQDREADIFADATRRFSEKNWKPVAFTPEAIADAEISRSTVTG